MRDEHRALHPSLHSVDFEKLERACLDTATEFGWTREVADIYYTRYLKTKEMGSGDVAKWLGFPHNMLSHTEIRLKGRFGIPKITIETHRNDPAIYGFRYSSYVITQSKTNEYFNAVHQRLSDEETKTEGSTCLVA